MNEAKFTPGPWEICGGCTPRFIAVVHQKQVIVDSMGDQNYDLAPDYNTQRANARLIAAAPDLLEALENLIDEQNGPPLVRRESQWQDAMKLARAAIKKARGE